MKLLRKNNLLIELIICQQQKYGLIMQEKLWDKKKKNQFYILTWHGMIGFKPVGRLRGDRFSKIAELVSADDAKNVDVLLSNSDWCSDVWKMLLE